jgi:hypothetical protein
MVLHIVEVEVCGPHSLDVRFNDGVRKQVDLTPLLTGPVFDLVRDPAYFARVVIDPQAGTVVWPNGADLAPEALYDLPADGHPRPGTG